MDSLLSGADYTQLRAFVAVGELRASVAQRNRSAFRRPH
jgi:hypothetical protein